MRCSANGAFLKLKLLFRLKTVPQAEPTPHHRLRAELSRCGSVRRGSRSPPETDSLPRPCFAALKGEARHGAIFHVTNGGQKGEFEGKSKGRQLKKSVIQCVCRSERSGLAESCRADCRTNGFCPTRKRFQLCAPMPARNLCRQNKIRLLFITPLLYHTPRQVTIL